jgi:hypothetical protein
MLCVQQFSLSLFPIVEFLHTAIAASDDGLWQISTKNLSCGTDGLFTPLNLFLLCLTGVCHTCPEM